MLLGLVVSLAIARSVVFVAWPQARFDADQAVIGLMAKHLAEGRAFPVFAYAQHYVLALESWLAAPLFLAFGPSASALKAVPAGVNVATTGLLYWILARRVGLPPWQALVATLPVALPGVVATADLTDALGMNPEPLLFTLLLWLARERPLLLGSAAAIGMLNREFTVYAVAALLAVDLLRTRDASFWRRRALAVASFAATWALVGVAKQFSSPIGPGTSMADMGGGSNLDVATAFLCVEPAAMARDARTVFGRLLPAVLGLEPVSLTQAGVNSSLAQGVPWAWALWPLLALVLAAATIDGLWRAVRSGPQAGTWFGLYLLATGAQAAVVYATTRCGNIGLPTNRYILLALLAPVGALTLALAAAPRPPFRRVLATVVVAWATLCGLDHARLAREYLAHRPPWEHQQLARMLLALGVRYIETDYWTGYTVAFLTGERVIALTDFERVAEYTDVVRANAARTFEVRRIRQERCAGAVAVADWYICPPVLREASP